MQETNILDYLLAEPVTKRESMMTVTPGNSTLGEDQVRVGLGKRLELFLKENQNMWKDWGFA